MSDLWEVNRDVPIEEYCPNCRKWWVADPLTAMNGVAECPSCLSNPDGAVCGIYFCSPQDMAVQKALEMDAARQRLVENVVFQGQSVELQESKRLNVKLAAGLLVALAGGAFYWIMHLIVSLDPR